MSPGSLPYDLLMWSHAIILGPIQGGRYRLALCEVPSSDLHDAEKYAASCDPYTRIMICELAVSTKNFHSHLVVANLASAEDGLGSRIFVEGFFSTSSRTPSMISARICFSE